MRPEIEQERMSEKTFSPPPANQQNQADNREQSPKQVEPGKLHKKKNSPAKHVLSLVEGAQRRQVRKRIYFLKPLRLSAFAGDNPISSFVFLALFAVKSSDSESLVSVLPHRHHRFASALGKP
jgi:hypothetical protein